MLNRYFNRLYDTIISRDYIEVEYLVFDSLPMSRGSIEGRLIFPSESLLEFFEVVLLRKNKIKKIRYAYHYQNKDGEIIFRYDNSPHYPDINTYPHHKHVGSQIEPAEIHDLSEILREIEESIFDSNQKR